MELEKIVLGQLIECVGKQELRFCKARYHVYKASLLRDQKYNSNTVSSPTVVLLILYKTGNNDEANKSLIIFPVLGSYFHERVCHSFLISLILLVQYYFNINVYIVQYIFTEHHMYLNI
jgi:hypothetical protein